jgi:hypothetical protein
MDTNGIPGKFLSNLALIYAFSAKNHSKICSAFQVKVGNKGLEFTRIFFAYFLIVNVRIESSSNSTIDLEFLP